MSYEKDNEEIKQYKDFPYTIVSHSCLLPDFSICLTAEGIKKIAKLLRKGDLLHILIHSDTKATEFEISRRKKK